MKCEPSSATNWRINPRSRLRRYPKQPKEHVIGSDLSMKGSWKNGLEFETEKKDFRVHVGGRTQFDGTWFEADDSIENGVGGVGPIDDGMNFRRARFRV